MPFSRHWSNVSSEAPRPCSIEHNYIKASTSSMPSFYHASHTNTKASTQGSSKTKPGAMYLKTTYEIPHLTKTPWELERRRRNSTWRRTRTVVSIPTKAFKNLPREVYDCIIVQLERLHFVGSHSCTSCYLNDLYSLCLTSRAWDRAATLQM